MKYVITGGAGFIGSHIAEMLAKDHEVIIIDNLISGKEANIESYSKQFRKGSIQDLSFKKKKFEGADGIFHQAAITSVPYSVANPLLTNDINITGTLNVLLAARDTGVKKVVYASSSSVYGDSPVLPINEIISPLPLSPYGVSKVAGEHYCNIFSKLYGLKTISLRYFNVFGPRQDPQSAYAAVIPKFISRVLNHTSIVIYGDGRQTRDFAYVKDVAMANIRSMERNVEGIFNIAYQQQIDLNNLAAMIMDITGIQVPIMHEPPRSGDIHDSLADISKSQKEFGYRPEYSVESGLMETIEWFKKQKKTA